MPQVRRVTLPGAKGAKHPGFVKPQLATLHVRPPQGERYLHEIKFDGYRLQANLRGGLPALFTRSRLNWTKRFPPIAGALSHVPATELIVDGEVISANDRGAATFRGLYDGKDAKKPLVAKFMNNRAINPATYVTLIVPSSRFVPHFQLMASEQRLRAFASSRR